MVTAPPLLRYYEREKDLVIQCDAREEGGGGVGACEPHYFKMEGRLHTQTEP